MFLKAFLHIEFWPLRNSKQSKTHWGKMERKEDILTEKGR